MRKVEETGIITKNYRYNIDENIYIETSIEIKDGIVIGKNVTISINEIHEFEIDYEMVGDLADGILDLFDWLKEEGVYDK